MRRSVRRAVGRRFFGRTVPRLRTRRKRVAYAAQGGTLSRKSQAQLLCESFGGLYLVGSGIQLWACEYLANSVAFEALERQCFQDGGEFFTFVNGDFFGLRIDGCLDLEPES